MQDLFPALPGLLMGIAALLTPGASEVHEARISDDPKHYRVMFYNTENFFDTRDDSLTNDGEFTPRGAMHWNYDRYNIKLNNLYKTIVALGGWQPPDIAGFCEVENKSILADLLYGTPLLKVPYRIIHANSPDRRGIDVALIYNSKTVTLIQSRYYRIPKPGLFTRDILYFKACINRDTCHFFINHWPSRSSGQLKTEDDRFSVASRLSFAIDSIFKTKANAKIIIMGDFNDEPDDESLRLKLKALTKHDDLRPNFLYNLSSVPENEKFKGTLKFQGQWNLFDQVIVSGSLLNTDKGLFLLPGSYRIFGPSFLLTPDDKFNGYKPYRTYNGYKYQGGFSDHLPVYVDLYIKK
jgi:predicted extracellular nuclease